MTKQGWNRGASFY